MSVWENPKVLRTTKPFGLEKPGPMAGLQPHFWTKGGVPIFFFEGVSDWDDWKPRLDTDNAGGYEDPVPGMVGVSWRGDRLFTILADGKCHEIATKWDTTLGEKILHTIDNMLGEAVPNVASED